MRFLLSVPVLLLSFISFQGAAQARPAAGSYPPGNTFKFVEKMPAFKGSLGEFLSSTLQYPESARLKNEEGRAIVQFVVTETGKVTAAQIVRTSGSASLDSEAIRAISLMPDWEPGTQQGKAVNVYFTIPVAFTLESPAQKEAAPADGVPRSDSTHNK
jgi:TonB family protein